jgi:hypothetical protein
MEPIGLTFKKDGELMIVHKCLRCGKLSPNRIAGDDNTFTLCSLIEKPDQSNCGIKLLTLEDKDQVLTCLYGKDYLCNTKV